jgi:hypothetical protein
MNANGLCERGRREEISDNNNNRRLREGAWRPGGEIGDAQASWLQMLRTLIANGCRAEPRDAEKRDRESD